MTGKLSIISFTEKGIRLSEIIAERLDGTGLKIALFTKCSRREEQGISAFAVPVEQRIGDWAKERMEERSALLFIGACGIAVRAVAPFITDKFQDSPVLVMDERGEYVIPLLSGHMGGANEFARKIAGKLGAIPVITTATDLNGSFAVDLFAKRNGLRIGNKDGIVKVSAKALAGEEILLSVEKGHLTEGSKCPEGVRIVPYPPGQPVDVAVTAEEEDFPAVLCLKPREYAIGMGCRKGKEAVEIEMLIHRCLQRADISLEQIFALASIDQKKEEPGFLAWCEKEKIPYLTFSAGELQEMEGAFSASAFVREQVGVDNVCERAALRACGTGGRLVCRKRAENGMTIAIAKRDWRVTFDA